MLIYIAKDKSGELNIFFNKPKYVEGRFVGDWCGNISEWAVPLKGGECVTFVSMSLSQNKKCCFCGRNIIGYGHNPSPVVEDINERCCGECNQNIVIPARLESIK